MSFRRWRSPARKRCKPGSAVLAFPVPRQNDPSAYEQFGVKLTARGFIAVDAAFQTSVESVYAIGDCNGISQLAHSASHQGIQVAEQLFGGAYEM
ncbi:MAG: NAD(P)/FAD-dependent oxidoreductase, partial [Alphaproteobacteria bacterium]|nr:NAD(P)/FAD-dependent oxidoreductase [Alphaproteobacteria bacterium]